MPKGPGPPATPATPAAEIAADGIISLLMCHGQDTPNFKEWQQAQASGSGQAYIAALRSSLAIRFEPQSLKHVAKERRRLMETCASRSPSNTAPSTGILVTALDIHALLLDPLCAAVCSSND